MAVVVNEDASVAQLGSFNTNTRPAKGAETDPFGEHPRFVNPEDARALIDHPRGCRRVDLAIVAQVVCATENAIGRPGKGIHERGVVGNDRKREIDFRNDRDLSAMWFKIGILHESSRPDAGAIDDEIERGLDVFQGVEKSVLVDLATRVSETMCEESKVDGRVHERHIQGKTGNERRGDFRAESSRAKWIGPIWNFNFTGARKRPQLQHRNAAVRIAREIEEDVVSFQRPRNRLLGGAGIVWIPNGGGGGGSGRRPDLLRENDGAIPARGENNRAG